MRAKAFIFNIFALVTVVEGQARTVDTKRRLFRRGTHESSIEAPEAEFAKKRAVSDSLKPRGRNGKGGVAGPLMKPKASSDPVFSHRYRKTSNGNSNLSPKIKGFR